MQEGEACYSVSGSLSVRAVRGRWVGGRPQGRTEVELRNGQVREGSKLNRQIVYFFWIGGGGGYP